MRMLRVDKATYFYSPGVLLLYENSRHEALLYGR
jgi:hypothetical protein